jgi:hypothetical protein
VSVSIVTEEKNKLSLAQMASKVLLSGKNIRNDTNKGKNEKIILMSPQYGMTVHIRM